MRPRWEKGHSCSDPLFIDNDFYFLACSLFPPDWLVIILVIVAIAAILLVCALVAKKNRYDFDFSFFSHANRDVM